MKIHTVVVTTMTVFLTTVLLGTAWAEPVEQPSPRDREIGAARERYDQERAHAEQESEDLERGQFEAVQQEYLEQRRIEDELDRLQAELLELRRLRLDLRERELEARPVRSDPPDEEREREHQEVLDEFSRVERQIQRIELEIQARHMERQRLAERRELKQMTERFEYVANWREVAFDPRDAVMMATQAIVELHVMTGEPVDAIEPLERLLAEVKDVGSRTAVRFALKDIYLELGRLDQAQEQMIEVFLENSRAMQGFDLDCPSRHE
ncbi:MAG: hypothetical protein KJ749_09600 [Planctomycetes bacterium]|nr:hypothetical protein [Planctomycetota bacterium]